MSPSIPGMDVLIADVAAGRLRGTEAFDEIVACIAAHETPAHASDEERQLVVEQAVRAVSQDRALCELLFAPPESAGRKPAPEVIAKPTLQPVEVIEADDDPFSGEGDDESFYDEEAPVAPFPLTDEEIDAELEAIEREREARQDGSFESPKRRGQLLGALTLGAAVIGGGVLWFLTRPDTCEDLVKRICIEGNTKSCEMVEFGQALEAKKVGEDKCVSVDAALDAALEGKKKSEKKSAFDRALVEALGFDPRGDDAPVLKEPKSAGPPPPTVVVEGQLGIADVFIDQAHVYWTSTQPPGVFRTRNIGGAIEAFGNHPDAIDVTPTKDFLYWVARGPTGGEVWVDRLRGKHEPSTIALEGFSPTRAAFLEGEFAFIDGPTGAVMMAPVGGGPPRILVPGRPVPSPPRGRKPKTPPPPGPAALPTELAGDDTHVFVLSPAPVSTVWAVPRDGQAPPRALATGQARPRTLTLDATHVYWIEAAAGAITRVPKGGGVPEVLATGQAGAAGLAMDAATVYWTNEPAGTVHSVAKAGGDVTTVASELSYPSFVAVDSVAVFYESGGSLFRQAR
ncbi:MAG: hypothetical protein KUG77_12455 [Nannocystaceae bacterium]|nr:hypothetical protein [Nannocystaceae bacterium]